MRTILLLILKTVAIQSSFGQKKLERIPDPVPVKDSYLLSGKLDSSRNALSPR